MVWEPTRAGPKNIREMYHWVHGQLRSVGELTPTPLEAAQAAQTIADLEARVAALEALVNP